MVQWEKTFNFCFVEAATQQYEGMGGWIISFDIFFSSFVEHVGIFNGVYQMPTMS